MRARRLAVLTVFTLGVSGACSGAPGNQDSNPADGDRPSNGSIRIDEAALSASADGGKIDIDIPVQALGKRARGSLYVSLRQVDDKKTLDSEKLSYDVAAGKTQHLTASLDKPADVAGQADWVKSNVRIDDGSAHGLRVTSSLMRVVAPYEIQLEGPQKLAQNKRVNYRIHARNPLTLKPLANLAVTLSVAQDGKALQTLPGTTDAAGDAVIGVQIPAAGSFSVLASAGMDATSETLESGIDVAEPGKKLLLTTDKPIYQPGQTLYLRALALAPPQNTPLSNQSVTFEVEDGKGNKIFKRDQVTDAYGVAATVFQLGRILNMGTFKVRALVGPNVSEKTIEVSRYALPKFRIGITLDRDYYGPGDSVHGALDAGYFFGKPVSLADVMIEGLTLDIGQTVFQKIYGKTDADGKMSFELKLPESLVGLPLEQGNALVTVRATVTDTAGQAVKKETPVTVAEAPVHVVLVPEATVLVPGIENRLDLYVSDPLGAPLGNVAAKLTTSGTSVDLTTDAWGHAAATLTPGGTPSPIDVSVTVTNGSPVTKSFDFSAQAGAEHVLVRTDKSVYDLGETVKVQVVASPGEAHAYVDWLNQGQAVDMRTLALDPDGVGSMTMPIDISLLGTNRVEAYIVDADGNVARAGRTLVARRGDSLNVTFQSDKPSYAPGQPAKLTFSVADDSGKPVVAALGVQVVDEAVFSLIDAQPGLLKTYFQLEDAYSKPQYEIQPPPGSLSDLLFDKTESPDPAEAAAAQAEAGATLAALGKGSITGINVASYAQVLAKASVLLAPYYKSEEKELAELATPTAKAVALELAKEGCSPQTYWCTSIGTSFTEAFAERIKGRIAAFDFWGNAYMDESLAYGGSIRLRTSGPDEKASNADDAIIEIPYSELGIDIGYPGTGGAGGGSGGTASGGAAGSSGGIGGAGAPGEGPRVRQDFPETLYVNPEVITGADGKATIDLDLADSITEWRVSTLAHSAEGKLGGGTGGIKVFQDFFADVNFPATLTRGDEVEFPIAVYNYLTTAQSVKLELTPASWYTPLGATAQTVDVNPNEVVGVRFPVRVDAVGVGTLTVTATGTNASDAVARKVLVVPDGKEFPTAVSGSLATGNVEHDVSFPANTVPGSPELYVEVYPAFLSQVVTGMDSMLQVPNGCFEQTTSTTWPNVLVTRYMTQTGQITPEIQLKAESLISAGYQRLLTFEHPGGGFSWFGEQDPKPFLSVTAFGLMEFADMAKVSSVDPAMVSRTQNWLISQQKADGSWEGDVSEFFSFQTSVLRNTAFVLCALGENAYSGPELAKAVSFVKANLAPSDDAYTQGLVANALVLAAPSDPATSSLFATLDAKKHVDGTKVYWDSEGTETNFYAGGNDAQVTATALVTHAMLLAGGYKNTVDGALSFLTGSKDSMGNFGSTQATIWTLRTLLLAAEKGTEGAVGSFAVSVDGSPFATLELTADKPDLMTLVDMKTLATLGSHDISLSFAGTGKVSYNVISRYHLPWADVPPDVGGPLSVSVSYDKTTLLMNDRVKATVSVVNNTTSIQNMVIVTVGIPPGFALESEDLDAYKTLGTLSSYEMTGKQLILYLSALPASATLSLEYHLRATMPVKATDGGAQAYLYYEPDKKTAAPATLLDVNGS